MRSKVKRSFRNKKRETGVYAATEAARLHRLNAKLVSVVSKDKDGDMPINGQEEDHLPGWSWFTALGLLDASEITAETMGPWERHLPQPSGGMQGREIEALWEAGCPDREDALLLLRDDHLGTDDH